MSAMGVILAAPGVAGAQGAEESAGAGSLIFTLIVAVLGIAALVIAWRRDVIRPGSFRRREPTIAPPVSAGPLLVFLFAGGLMVSAAASLVTVLALGIEVDAGGELTLRERGIHTIAISVAGVVASAGLLLVAHRVWKSPRFDPLPRGIVLGLALGVGVTPLMMLVTTLSTIVFELFGKGPADAIGHETLDTIVSPEIGAWRWAFILGAVIATPIFEEVLFRGMLQSAAASLVRNRWAAILIASVVFVLPHISSAIEPHTLPAIGVLGIAMGIAYERTGRIWVPIGMHTAYNGINVALSFVVLSGV